MKRHQIVELALLAVAIIMGYKFIESVFNSIAQILFGLTSEYGNYMKYVLQTFFIGLFYFGVFILIVRNSKKLTAFILRNVQPLNAADAVAEETIPVNTGAASILQIVIIAICLNTLVIQVPNLLIHLYNYFSRMTGHSPDDDVTMSIGAKTGFAFSAMATVMAIILTYFSHTLSKWLLSSAPFVADDQNRS